MTLSYYIDKLQSIRPDRSAGRARPHKVCMMFAVIDLIEQGYITDNRIFYDDTLKNRFSWHFERLRQGNDADSPFLPFFHLKTSDIWHLALKPEEASYFSTIVSGTDAVIRRAVNYASLDDALFQFLKSPHTSSILRNALSANLDSLEDQYGRWAKSIGKSDKTIRNYVGALKNSIPNWLSDAGVAQQSLLSIGSYFEYEQIISKTYEVREFVEKDKRGNGMYSAAIKSYRSFLCDVTQVEVQQDIDNIILDKTIPDTQKAMMVNTRIGQGRFRDDLIAYWQGCAITRYQNHPFLIASHIKPWAQSDNAERLDPYNGLLLLANIDKAFDLGYVSFNEKGRILISEYLEDYTTLGLDKGMSVLLSRKHQDYLAYHRESRFKDGNN
jgi:predicted restriction endonuclease